LSDALAAQPSTSEQAIRGLTGTVAVIQESSISLEELHHPRFGYLARRMPAVEAFRRERAQTNEFLEVARR